MAIKPIASRIDPEGVRGIEARSEKAVPDGNPASSSPAKK